MKIFYTLIATFCLLFGSGIKDANAATISAAQSGLWSATSTWTGGVVPGALDDVQIVVDATVTITIDQNVTVNSIKLGAGGTVAKKDTLILDTNKTLTVTGNFTWDKVGVFQQNAGSSVTAANYVFGTSGSGYSMAVWNIYGVVDNRVSVHGAGNIVAAAPTLPPVQQVNWQYADFDINGYTAISLKDAWDANARSSLNIDHCYFNGTGYVDIGQYANSGNDLKITNSDFRNITSVLSGYNANLTIRTSALGIIGNFSFDGNVFSQPTMGKVYLSSVGNNREFKNNVFRNSSLDHAYLAGVPVGQRSIKIFNNVFYADASAGSVNGQLLDTSGGLEIYDNLFIGIPYNTHTIMFTGAYAADLPKTIIRNNVFDMADGDSDVLNLNYVPVDIINNIFINKGTPINLGVSGGGGGGSLSPNSGYVNAINNTSYLRDTVAALIWAGETSQHTGGAVTVKNNLIGASYAGTSFAYKDSQSTIDAFDYIDNTWFYPDTGATLTKYEGVVMTGKTQGSVGFGAYDQTGDPQFFDETRLATTYDASLGGPGTTNNLVSEMMKRNGNVSGEILGVDYNGASALSYFRAGFTPTNKSLAVSGENGGYMGAILITSEPTAPTIDTVTAGNAQATVTFSEPSSNGGSSITEYTVTSNPGDITATGSASPITVTGLSNGTSYTFTVTATNAIGTSPASSASDSVTPQAPIATMYTFTGPASGNVNSASTNFTVTPNNSYTGTITLTPSGAGSAGLVPIVVTFSDSATPQTFTITPIVAGVITFIPTNDGGLTNPSDLSYTANAVEPTAPTIDTVTAGNAQATVTFSEPSSNGGSSITEYTVTSNPGDITATGSASPITVTGLSNGTSYTFTVTATNAIGTSPASSASDSIIPRERDKPVTSVSVPAGSYKEAQSVDLLCNDGGGSGCSGTYYTVDGTIPTTESSLFSSSLSIDSPTVLKFFSLDADGNAEEIQSVSYIIDSNSPVVFNGYPRDEVFPSSTTSISLSLDTDEDATCRYSNQMNQEYGTMNIFDSTNEMKHSTFISNLKENAKYFYYVKCVDSLGNVTEDDYALSFTIEAIANTPSEIKRIKIKFEREIKKFKDTIRIASSKFTLQGRDNTLSGGSVKIYKEGKFWKEVSIDGEGFWKKTLSIGKNASKKIKAVFYDAQGSVLGTQSAKIKVDIEKPEITAFLDSRKKVRRGEMVEWKARDNKGIDYYKVTFNGKIKKTKKPSFVIPITTNPGLHEFIVKVYDKTGNSSYKKVLITVL